jgi:nucleotide-binding universal stress UspA family protein
MRVLIAIDGSSCSEAAVESISRRPWPPGSHLRIISVVELPIIPTPETWALPESYFNDLEKATRDQAEEAVAAANERLRERFGSEVEITTEIISGHPKEVILDEAEKWGADLIVLGSHGYRGWQRFLLGSVSQAVASHAKCSVEIVRGESRQDHPQQPGQ